MKVSHTTVDAAKTLDKVRKLLDKAASSDFEDEAQTFYEAAHRIMQTHAISEVEITKRNADSKRQKPIVRTITIKSRQTGAMWLRAMLSTVAQHNRCRMWYSGDDCTVAGFESDVLYVDLLYTSLVLQLDRSSILAIGQSTTRSHSKTFFADFTAGYVRRLSVRLDELQIAGLTSVSSSQSILLRHREQEIEDFVYSMVGRLQSKSSNRSIKDREAHGMGEREGSKADLGGVTRQRQLNA